MEAEGLYTDAVTHLPIYTPENGSFCISTAFHGEW
jgi:hypothetical protein